MLLSSRHLFWFASFALLCRADVQHQDLTTERSYLRARIPPRKALCAGFVLSSWTLRRPTREGTEPTRSTVTSVKMMDTRDYYALLGVDRRAGSAEIKSAFKKLAMNFHPDVSKDPEAHVRAYAVLCSQKIFPALDYHLNLTAPSETRRGRQEKFVLINEAYSVLSDAEQRARYDGNEPPRRGRDHGAWAPHPPPHAHHGPWAAYGGARHEHFAAGWHARWGTTRPDRTAASAGN